MKKKFLISSLLLVMLFVTGCGKETQKTMECTRTGKGENYSFEYDYKVDYTGKYVDVINITEKIMSEDTEYLETVKETVESMYSPFKDIKYHSYDVEVSDNTLTSHRYIDYEHIDTNEMLKVDSAFAAIIKNGKVAIDDVKTVYTALGLTCK